MCPYCKFETYKIQSHVADFQRLDDVEDGSEVRRGKPATHIVFGPSQTTNSAGYMMMVCLENVLSLNNKGCLDAYTGLHFCPRALLHL